MTSSLDFTLLPIIRQQGLSQPELPGLQAALAPRRAGRGRAQDRLVMHLALQGNAPLSPKAQGKLLDSLHQTYFKTGGSSTAAMRVVAESLNQSLFSRNQRGASRGMRSLGIFTLAVFRSRHLFLGQCGAAHALLVQADGVQHFHDPAAAGRGLGMGRATPIQYHQSEVAAGDFLIICPALPPTWPLAFLRALRGQPLGQMHTRLLAGADTDLEAVLIQITAGSGTLRTLRPERAAAVPSPSGDEISAPPVDLPSPAMDPAPRETRTPPEARPKPQMTVAATPQAEPAPQVPPGKPAPKPAPPAETVSPVAPAAAPQPQKTPKPPREPVIGPALLAIGRAVGVTVSQFFDTLKVLIRRILPDEKMLDLPPSVMLFGALAVPLMIVAAASVIYFREGRGRMHQEQLHQAQAVAEQALLLENPVEIRAAWEQVVVDLDLAENYGSSEDSQTLRAYAYSVLDTLNIVDRLDYQPGLVGSLPTGAVISKVVLNADNELYLLNRANGYVLRATYTDQGYALDPIFNCGPISQPLMVGPLIDIAALPRGEADSATLLGLDANGNLLRCIPGEQNHPVAVQMAPPDLNWGQPTAFALNGGNIYVLDPQTNAVWIYWAIDDYTELPTYYFGNQVPPLQSVVDMIVSDGNLYLLHDDGRMTVCTYSSYVDSPTRCTDPAEYTDLREGYQSGVVMQGTDFAQMQFAPPPDPSLYLFDPQAEAIYHLSMRLAFHRQYRPHMSQPQYPPRGETITAFAVGPNRQAFLVTEKQVYIAMMP